MPVLLFSAILVVRVASEERTRVERDMVDLNRALAAALDRELLVSVGVLELLAQSSTLAANDLAAFHAEASQAVATRSGWLSVIVLSPDGRQLLNTSHPFGAPLPRVDEPESLAELVRTRKPVVGSMMTGQKTGQLAFPVRVPVVRGGRVTAIVTAAVRPDSLQDLLVRTVPPRGEWARAFNDRHGTIVARSREPERFVGRSATSQFVARVATTHEAVYRDVTVDGADVYVVFSRAPFSGWTAAMAMPAALVDGPLRNSIAWTLVSGIALTALTGTAAYLVGRRIAQPIREATLAAQALTRGEPVTAIPSSVREVAELGVALDRSAELLRQRERERDELLAAAEIARLEAEAANRAKDDFLATLSHELRTPLNAMMGWVRMLRGGMLPPERAAQALEAVDRNLVVQTKVISDLLDVSRIIAGKLELDARPTDVRAAVHGALEQVRHQAEAKGVAMDALLPPDPALVNGDHARLVQIVVNLLSNAVKATSEGGKVTVEVMVGPAEISIAVTDTGYGIPAEAQPRIFERFHQAETGGRGLGLGLAIVRNVTALHGGSVDVFSEGEGAGACFVVALPRLHAAPAGPDPTPAAPSRTVREGLRALVVEDADDNREMLTTVLQTHGVVVTAVASADSALAAWDRGRFDVLVSDLRMPRRDGYALMAEIRRREREGERVRAIAVSANAALADKERARAAGFDVHLSKPIDVGELLAALG